MSASQWWTNTDVADYFTTCADYLPTYFQACKGSSPLRSSVELLPITLVIAPFAFFGGGFVQVSQKYRWVNVLGWSCLLVGFGLLSLLDPSTSTGKWVGYQIVAAAGLGLLVRHPPTSRSPPSKHKHH